MLCYLTTKIKICKFFQSLFTVGVSIISEQPSYSKINFTTGNFTTWKVFFLKKKILKISEIDDLFILISMYVLH